MLNFYDSETHCSAREKLGPRREHRWKRNAEDAVYYNKVVYVIGTVKKSAWFRRKNSKL